MPAGNVDVANVVPYLGELFQTIKRPNTILKLLGGLHGGVVESTAMVFPIASTWSIPAPSQPARLEGANAPSPNYRALTQTTNVIQIFQEAVQITYLAQSDKAVGGVVPIPQGKVNGPLVNPRSQEFQVMTTLEKIAQDANYSFLNGVYADPADPSTAALQTRGILTAIATNSIDDSAGSGWTVTNYKAAIETLVQTIIQQTGFSVDDTWTLFAGVNEYNNVQASYESKTTPPYDREIGGLKLKQIYTRMGILNLVLEPDMPAQYLMLGNLNVCRIVGLPVPGKGMLFEEPLFKQGSADQTQIYGQLGIDHGPEYMHGKLKVPAGLTF